MTAGATRAGNREQRTAGGTAATIIRSDAFPVSTPGTPRSAAGLTMHDARRPAGPRRAYAARYSSSSISPRASRPASNSLAGGARGGSPACCLARPVQRTRVAMP